jgi:multidrug efflux pump
MMLPEICIRRPVFATVINLIIILLGIICYNRLSVREYPNIDVPVVTVQTRYVGANAQIIESQITTPLEDSLSGIEGIDFIRSVSRSEVSEITITFRLDIDVNAAVSDVRDRVGRVRDRIPEDAKEPVIAKVEADAQPIIWLAFTSEQYSPLEITDIANRLVKDRLQTLPGIADILIFGEQRYTMRVWLDPLRLAAYQITPNEIEAALRSQNLEVPSGRIQGKNREFTVLSATDLNTKTEFEQIILRSKDHKLVRLSDVAKIEIGTQDVRQIARYNSKNAIALGVIKQSTANPLTISKAIYEALPEIIETLPNGLNIEVAYDSSKFIDYSIKSVFHTIIEAIVLVIVVIYIFLRSFRATLIPLVTIPVSLIGTFILMNMAGFSINTLTLLAMVLAIGLVVDDAIVVLENIHRHLEKGKSPLQAAIDGSKEIGFAVICMTLTLAAVFAPIAFSTGRTGKLFIEFALTLAGAVIVSGFTALTLSPTMCARMLTKEEHQSSRLNTFYQNILDAVLRHRSRVIWLLLFSFLLLTVLFLNFRSELAPIEDRGSFLSVAIAPEGSTLQFTDKYVKQMEQAYQKVPEIKQYFAATGFPTVSRAITFNVLSSWGDRKRSQEEIVKELGPHLFMIPGILAFPLNPPSLGQSPLQRPIEIVLQTTDSFEELDKMVKEIMKKAAQSPILQNMDSDLQLNSPELKITVDRDKVAAIGTTVGTVSRAIETLISGREVTRFKRDNKQYDVIVQNAEHSRNNPNDLTQIYIHSEKGAMVPLSNLASVTEDVAPKDLNHFNKLRSATLTATVAPGYSLDEGLKAIESIVKENIKVGTQIDYGGVSREFKESKNTIYIIFGLALCFIYLVLAAQFESFIDPLTILFSVPLAIVGALLTLKLTGGTLNIYTQIGLITLVGLITKHGILIVEFANQLLDEGATVLEAVTKASVQRLRPILMTTGAMVLGSLPLAFASGAGAVSLNQIGWIIVGGLTIGTLFTLFVVPTVYSYLAKGNVQGSLK